MAKLLKIPQLPKGAMKTDREFDNQRADPALYEMLDTLAELRRRHGQQCVASLFRYLRVRAYTQIRSADFAKVTALARRQLAEGETKDAPARKTTVAARKRDHSKATARFHAKNRA